MIINYDKINYMTESEFHKIIKENKDVQRNLVNTLGIQGENIIFNSEDQFPNGMFADFSIIADDKVKAIIELKGSDIGVNDYVRGTGQLFQYQHFIDLGLSIKSYIYDNAKAVYCFPSSLITQTNYNIGLFNYPKGSIILEFNEENLRFRIISELDLKVFAGERGKEMVTISHFYIRDNRLFEIYIALKYLNIKKLIGLKTISRQETEAFLSQLNTPNNANWRNVFISLSSLGLIDHLNVPTEIGSSFSSISFSNFAYEIYNSYIKGYFKAILQNLIELGSVVNEITLHQLKTSINSSYSNKEVLFLTDAETRYLSSWLNIMKDDFGCINFVPNSKKRTYNINYPIDLYNKKAICGEIEKRSNAYFYIDMFDKIMQKVV